MSYHLEKQIDKLKKLILQLGKMVEESVRGAIQSIQDRDATLAQKIRDGDSAINDAEVDVEEECLHTLALYQPVAQDLRYVIAILKINNDLERIADLAVNIAKQAYFLSNEAPLNVVPFDLPEMAKSIQFMLKNSLDAVVNLDPELAQSVRDTDDRVDEIHRLMYQQVAIQLRDEPEHINQLIHLLGVSRHLERIADLTVNIAEDVLYMAKGEIVRHGGS